MTTSVNEATIVDSVRDELKNKAYYKDIFNIEREQSQNSELSKLLSQASKRKTGHLGKCDLILTPKDPGTKVYILIECKKNTKKHGVLEDKSDADVKNKAVPGVAHYISSVWEQGSKSMGYTLIGIAVSGSTPNRKVTVVGICNNQNKDDKPYIKELSKDTSHIPNYKEILSQLYSFKNIPGVEILNNNNNTAVATFPLAILHRLDFSNEAQRHYSIAHKNEIVASLSDLRAQDKSVILPGVIIIVVCQSNWIYYIIDGQHRFEAYKEYYQRYKSELNIFFQLFWVDNFEDVKRMYETHYKAMAPIESEKTLPEKKEDAVTSNGRGWAYDLTTKLFDVIAEKWSIVNESTAPPYIHRSSQMDCLEKYLTDNEDFYKDYTIKDLMKLIKKKNKALAVNPPSQTKSNAKKSYGKSTYDKADRAGCYLGLIWANEWLIS